MDERANGTGSAIRSPFPPKTRIYGGWKALLVRIKFMVWLNIVFLRKKPIPLSLIRASRKKSRALRRELKLGKTVKFGKSYYSTLTMPHWPSRAFSHMLANGGLNHTLTISRPKRHISTAFLGITQKCRYQCQHCYERFNLDAQDRVPLTKWKDVIRIIQRIGASIIVLSGGEPMLRFDDLLSLLESGDKDMSDFHLHSSGHGVTPEKARQVRKAGLQAAGVGVDDFRSECHDAIRGYPGAFQEALRAIKSFQDAGVFTYINMCLTKNLVRSGTLWKYLEFVKSLEVGIIRVLEPKPCGGYFQASPEDLFSEVDRKAVTDFFLAVSGQHRYRSYPLISYESYFEAPQRMGCGMAGYSHFYINSLGNVQPCVFVPVSFGNIMEEDFLTTFKRMKRKIPSPLHVPCPAVSLAAYFKSKNTQALGAPLSYQVIEKECPQAWGKR